MLLAMQIKRKSSTLSWPHTSSNRRKEKRIKTPVDYELIVYGLPNNVLSLPSSFITGTTYRDWTSPLLNQGTSTSTTPILYKAFVIRLPNADSRDRILESAPKLKTLKANSIFGEGGNIEVHIRPLWPPEVHKLFTMAIRSSKNHNYARPIVVKLVVCLRQTSRSPLIPIYSEQELHRILPPPTSRLSNPPTPAHQAIPSDQQPFPPSYFYQPSTYNQTQPYPLQVNQNLPPHSVLETPLDQPLNNHSLNQAIYNPSSQQSSQKSMQLARSSSVPFPHQRFHPPPPSTETLFHSQTPSVLLQSETVQQQTHLINSLLPSTTSAPNSSLPQTAAAPTVPPNGSELHPPTSVST